MQQRDWVSAIIRVEGKADAKRCGDRSPILQSYWCLHACNDLVNYSLRVCSGPKWVKQYSEFVASKPCDQIDLSQLSFDAGSNADQHLVASGMS